MAVSLLYSFTNRPWGTVRNLTLPVDGKIPFIPGFVLVYHTWYPLTLSLLFLLYRKERRIFVESALSAILGNLFANATFLLFQTEVPRPQDFGQGFLERILRATYGVDNPYNGFPSIHVLVTTVLVIGILRTDFSRGKKAGIMAYGILIILSTWLIRQHVFLDILGGILYGILVYGFTLRLFTKDKVTSLFDGV